MSLTARAVVKLASELTSALDLTTTTDKLDRGVQWNFTDGAAADQVDRIWHDQRTLAASGTENLDLAGSLTDPFGATITFARIKLVYVTAASGNTNDVQVIREATNGVPLFLAAGDGIPIKPGGAILWIAPDADGVVVTAGTGDLLTVTNSAAGSSITYDVVIAGAAS